MKSHKHLFILAAIVLLALGLRVVFFSGTGLSDSLGYARLANHLVSDSLDTTFGHSGLRIGLLFPTAWLYGAFGVNNVTSSLFPLILSLGSVIMMYALGTLFANRKAGLIAAFLMAIFPFDVVYSTRLMSDLPSMFFTLLGIYLFFYAELKKTDYAIWFYLGGGIAFGFAYLIKELSLLIGLFVLAYVAYKRSIDWRWLYGVLGFFLIFCIDLAFFYQLTGNPLERFSTIDSRLSESVKLQNNYGRGDLPGSLLHYPYIILTEPLFGYFYAFFFLAIAYCLVNRRKETDILLLWFVPLIAYISFGSMSIREYIPIAASARFLSIITPAAILLLAYVLSDKNKTMRNVVMPASLIFLFVTSFAFVFLSTHRHDLSALSKVHDYLETLPEKPIYVDNRSYKALAYLNGYKEELELVRFHEYSLLNPSLTQHTDLNSVSNAYVVINENMLAWLQTKSGMSLSPQVLNIPENWERLGSAKDTRGEITVYQLS